MLVSCKLCPICPAKLLLFGEICKYFFDKVHFLLFLGSDIGGLVLRDPFPIRVITIPEAVRRIRAGLVRLYITIRLFVLLSLLESLPLFVQASPRPSSGIFHFLVKKLAHIKNLQYFCTRFNIHITTGDSRVIVALFT